MLGWKCELILSGTRSRWIVGNRVHKQVSRLQTMVRGKSCWGRGNYEIPLQESTGDCCLKAVTHGIGRVESGGVRTKIDSGYV